MTTDSDAAQLRLTTHEGVALVTLVNPRRANALSNKTFGEDLPAMLSAISQDSTTRALVITGEGNAFCAGSELDAEGFTDASREDTVELLRRAHRNVAIIRNMPVPSIAAIDGVAIGAGLGLAMACDIRFASPDAKFSSPYIRMGLTPDMGNSFLIPESVGISHALEFMLTAKTMRADEALRIGLISRIESDPVRAARELATSIAALPKNAIERCRSLIFEASTRGLDWTLHDGEPSSFADFLVSQEFQDQFSRYQASLRENRANKEANKNG